MQQFKYDVAVIVVGMNASGYVRECFRSLLAAEWDGFSSELIYIDNGSTDDTLSMLRQELPEVRVEANSTNLGFCKAANQGAGLAESRYVFFLNDDTLVLGNAVAALVAHAEQHPGTGAVGGRLLNTDGTEQFSGRRFPTAMNAVFGRRSFLTRLFPNAPSARDYCYKRELAAGEPFAADWVSAAAVLFPASVFRAIGGFAEDYYYWHEAIFSDRVRGLGYGVELLPAARIIHHEGQGSGPRPFKVLCRHAWNFHTGAYRCYCEHYGLGRWNGRRVLLAAVLAVRTAGLMGLHAVRALARAARSRSEGSRFPKQANAR